MKKKRLLTIFLFLISICLVGCGKKKKTTTIETTKKTTEHVHNFGAWKTIVSPTCNEDGLKKRACTCGEIEFEVIDMTPHT